MDTRFKMHHQVMTQKGKKGEGQFLYDRHGETKVTTVRTGAG